MCFAIWCPCAGTEQQGTKNQHVQCALQQLDSPGRFFRHVLRRYSTLKMTLLGKTSYHAFGYVVANGAVQSGVSEAPALNQPPSSCVRVWCAAIVDIFVLTPTQTRHGKVNQNGQT